MAVYLSRCIMSPYVIAVFLACAMPVQATTPIAASTCKSLSDIISKMEVGVSAALNSKGDTCFYQTLDLKSVPFGRTTADLKGYYATGIAKAVKFQNDAANFKQTETQYSGMPLATLQTTFLGLLNQAQPYSVTGAAPITDLSSVKLYYKDPQNYKLNFHTAGNPATLYFENHLSAPSESYTEKAAFESLVQSDKIMQYAVPSASSLGAWSIEYYLDTAHTKPVTTIQHGHVVNGNLLLSPLRGHSHYVVHGNGASGYPGSKPMGFGIVDSSAYLAKWTSSSCAFTKSLHKQNSCCAGSSRI